MIFKHVLSTLLKPKWSLYKNLARRASDVGHWNKDYQPGPYPKTFEERVRAAAKYNLDVEDYEPYSEKDYYGDYPKLPDISDTSKDSFYPWDFPERKRNYYEPLHVESDMYSEDRFDVDIYYNLRPPFWEQVAQFIGAITLGAVLLLVFETCKMFPAVAPKQYPHQDVTHYTFERCTE